MTLLDVLFHGVPDVANLQRDGNIPALINVMGHSDPRIQVQAVSALAAAGPGPVPLIISALSSPHVSVRLGAAEVLAALQDPRATQPLIRRIPAEKKTEVLLAVVFALGEIGSPQPVPDLVLLLRHENRYIRYAAARALVMLGWQPDSEQDRCLFLIALQDWDSVLQMGPGATGPLSEIFRDTDPATRSRILSLLGRIGGSDAHAICQNGLKDKNAGTRWAAVLASMNCGIRFIQLPPLVAARERTGPNPAAAALLNFLFLGIGYNYIGKWWGFPVFMAYMSVLVLAQLTAGPLLPYLIAYPITAILGVHTYFVAERMSDL